MKCPNTQWIQAKWELKGCQYVLHTYSPKKTLNTQYTRFNFGCTGFCILIHLNSLGKGYSTSKIKWELLEYFLLKVLKIELTLSVYFVYLHKN